MTLLAFSSKAQVGKDSAANYLANTYYFKTEAFATSLKEGIARGVFGLTDNQINLGGDKEKIDPFWNLSSRQIMQQAGEGMRKAFGEDLWIKTVKRRIDQASTYNYAISDVRYKSEAEAVKAWGGYVIKINRNIKGTSFQHISETDLDDWNKFDEVIDNNGDFNHLYAQLDKIVSKYILSPSIDKINEQLPEVSSS